jgi:prophage antirepressor-like protein
VRETDYRVRVIVIDGEAWVVLADLCRVLGVARSASNVTQQIDPDGIREAYRIIDNFGRTQARANSS